MPVELGTGRSQEHSGVGAGLFSWEFMVLLIEKRPYSAGKQ